MKYKSVLILSTLISIFSLQSQAADNLCDLNLQKIDDVLHTAGQNLGGGVMSNLEQAKKDAMEAKKSGDIDKCISITARVLNSAENSSMGGGRG